MFSPEQLDLERSEKLPLRPLHEKGKRGVAALEIDDDHGGREAHSSPSVVAASSTSPSSLPSPAAAAAAAAATGLAPYFKLLGTNAPFARLYAGELLNSAGQWFSYVSTLRIVNEASAAAASAAAGGRGASSSSLSPHGGGGGGSASAIGVVVAIHYLPSFFLSPIAGVAADRLPRENVLAAASLAGAAAAALLGVVQARLGVPFFLLLLSVQYSAAAFYDPARRALTPSLVGFDENALVLATTLDTVCWSTMTSVGASLGGVALSRLGARWCFFLDSLTYLAAAAAALSLRGCVKKKAAVDGGGGGGGGGAGAGAGGGGGGGVGVGGQQQQLEPAPRGLPSRMRKAKTSFRGEIGEERGAASEEEGEGESSSSSSDSDREQGRSRLRHHLPSSSLSSSPLRGNNDSAAAAGAKAAPPSPFFSSSPAEPSSSPSPSPSSVAALAATALRAAAADVKDGLRYAASHPHVLALTTLKLSGTLVWGAADVMNVKLSDTPSLAVKKKKEEPRTATGAARAGGDGDLPIDSAATLGFIFAAVGVGAMLGSVASNALTSPDARSLLRSAAAAFGLLTLGYASLSAAAAWSSLAAVLAASAARAAGSAVLWTYSTLLLQVEVPDALLGRTCALEQALYTLGECFSAMAAGLLFDAAAAAKAAAAAAAAAAAKAASKAAAGTTNEDVSVEAAAALMALVAGAFWAFWASYVRLHEKRRAK